ncbi:MAG: hypothetical protein ACOC2W_00725 [bacterium]
MIIYHNQHDKNSRDFISRYGDKHTIYDYPECLNHCNTISSFPTIVIHVPSYYQELETEEVLNEETNEIEEEIINEPGNVEEYDELFSFYDDQYTDIDDFYTKAMEFKDMVEQRAIDSPPQ